DRCASACRTVGPSGAFDVRPQRSVQVDLTSIPELKYAHRGERLGDRADAVGVLGRRPVPTLDVCEPDGARPDDLAAVEDCNADRGQTPLGLRRREDPVELAS